MKVIIDSSRSIKHIKALKERQRKHWDQDCFQKIVILSEHEKSVINDKRVK